MKERASRRSPFPPRRASFGYFSSECRQIQGWRQQFVDPERARRYQPASPVPSFLRRNPADFSTGMESDGLPGLSGAYGQKHFSHDLSYFCAWRGRASTPAGERDTSLRSEITGGGRHSSCRMSVGAFSCSRCCSLSAMRMTTARADSFSAAWRAHDWDHLSSVSPIDTKVFFVHRQHRESGMEFTHADKTQIRKIGAAVVITLR